MPEGPPEKKQRLEDPGRPVVQANSCIQFHFLNTQGKDTPYHSQLSFPPEFTHQLFGDDEEIKGFEGLQIRVNLAQPSFRAYVDVACTLHRPDADDVDGQFRKHFPDVSFSKADFTQKLARDAAQLTTAQLGEPIRHSQGTTVHHFNLSKAAQILKVRHLASSVACLHLGRSAYVALTECPYLNAQLEQPILIANAQSNSPSKAGRTFS